MADANTIVIDVNFGFPELIGSEGTEQTLTVHALFSDFEPAWDDDA